MNLIAGCYEPGCEWIGTSDRAAEQHTKTTTHARRPRHD